MSRSGHTTWQFPPLSALPAGEDLIAVGADLEPATLVSAYASGYFPMPLGRRKLGWFSPDPRGVFLPGDLAVSRSLRRSLRRYEVTVDTAFREVIRACGDPAREHGWINDRIVDAYERLHHLGIAHSVEAWDDDGLAGGLYGLAIGGFFAGESMFHRRTDASKVALVHLVDLLELQPGSDRVLDVQWTTPHLSSLGARALPRNDYAPILELALDQHLPAAFAGALRETPPSGSTDSP